MAGMVYSIRGCTREWQVQKLLKRHAIPERLCDGAGPQRGDISSVIYLYLLHFADDDAVAWLTSYGF